MLEIRQAKGAVKIAQGSTPTLPL